MKVNGDSVFERSIPVRVRKTRQIKGLVANPDAPDAPAITVPEALPLPEAFRSVTGIDHIGRTAISISGAIIARAVIITVLGGDRAADDGATDQSRGDTGRNTALRMGGRGHRHGRNGQRGGGAERHQCLLHGLTFLVEQKDRIEVVCRGEKFHISLK